jgi:SAM-dependent methyltransferase
MSSSPEYVFTRDYLDNNRINLQHYLVVQLFGYRIHPSIPVKDVNNPRIADIGTGTGIWLTDLADEFPATVQLDGLDISFDAAPPRDWLSPNMNLHHWDIKAEVPEHLVGVYDVVNVRHFAFVLQQSDLKGVLDNLFKLLSMSTASTMLISLTAGLQSPEGIFSGLIWTCPHFVSRRSIRTSRRTRTSS